jgi:hypothetical protein
MLVLIDESGDAGFKLLKGSSPYFILGMVIFRDLKMAEKTSQAICSAKASLNIKPEFRFSKTSFRARDGFFQAVSPFSFGIRVVVVEKEIIRSSFLKEKKDKFYNYFVQQILRQNGSILYNASVKIDGSGDRKFKENFAKYLREQIDSNKIKKVKFADSRSDYLIQLADMVTSAIARSYHTEKPYFDRWKNMVNSKIEDVWQFR